MHSAEIGNSIDLSGAALTEAVSAVFLQEATVRGTVSICDGFSSFGRVEVQSAHIEGNLVCDGCKLAALYCANMTLKGDLQWTGIQDSESTTLWLNGATIKSLRDERESWPNQGGLHLDGLQYEELTLHSVRTDADRRNNSLGQEHPLKIKDRVEWLQLQPASDQAEPQPWMQLAALSRAKGDDDGAKRIIFELRCAQLNPPIRLCAPGRLDLPDCNNSAMGVGFHRSDYVTGNLSFLVCDCTGCNSSHKQRSICSMVNGVPNGCRLSAVQSLHLFSRKRSASGEVWP